MKLLVIGKEGRLAKYTPDASMYAGYDISYVPMGSSDEELLAAGRDADFILVDAMGRVSGDVIRQMPNLKMIHSEGVGFNFIDVEAAREKHVYVCNCKGMNATAVAEQAILLMLGLLRDVVRGDRSVRAATQIRTKEGYMLAGSLKELGDCTIGLVGFGDIARATAKMAKAFGAEVVYYDIFRAKPELEAEYGVTYMELDELLTASDIVSMHIPVTKDTQNMADEAFFRKMKKGAYFVNTSRGELVVGEDLLAAIREGQLSGAGLDTIAGEPVQKDNVMINAEPEVAEKLIFSCHIGGITGSSFRRGYEMVWSDIKRMEAGQKPEHVVNAWE